MGVQLLLFFYTLQEIMGVGSGGPEGPSRWPKATRPPQELEVGACRAPYLLVCLYLANICLLVHIHGYNDIWLYGCLNLQDDPTSSPLKTRPHLDIYFLSYCNKKT